MPLWHLSYLGCLQSPPPVCKAAWYKVRTAGASGVGTLGSVIVAGDTESFEPDKEGDFKTSLTPLLTAFHDLENFWAMMSRLRLNHACGIGHFAYGFPLLWPAVHSASACAFLPYCVIYLVGSNPQWRQQNACCRSSS